MPSEGGAKSALRLVSGTALADIPPDALVAIAKVRDEAWRLPFWLAYHRWLGVDHFVVIDNRSLDETPAILAVMPDVTLFDAPGVFRGPAGYRSWIAHVVASAPRDRWNLVLDADELYLPLSWRKDGLRHEVARLEAEDVDAEGAIMVDCYPDSLPEAGQAMSMIPWERAPFFDAGPYAAWKGDKRRPRIVYGGVRERLFWPHWRWQRRLPKIARDRLRLEKPPFIGKWPLFRRAPAGYANIHEPAHQPERRSSRLSYLLHYKIEADLRAKIGVALAERQYFGGSVEYAAYARGLGGGLAGLVTGRSRRFLGLRSVIEARICKGAVMPAGGIEDAGIEKAACEIAGLMRPL